MNVSTLIRRSSILALCLAGTVRAQDTTTRGVRIGLTYDPGTRPGVVVLPAKGVGADSIRAILQRRIFDFSRVARERHRHSERQRGRPDRARHEQPGWPIPSRKLGAAASVAGDATPTGFHLAVYDVAKQVTALVRDYVAPPMTEMRAWRAVVHGMSDELEESLTGTRGISRTRVLFERDHRIWMVDSDGMFMTPS